VDAAGQGGGLTFQVHHQRIVEVGLQALHRPEMHHFAPVEAEKRGRVERSFQLAQRLAEHKATALMVHGMGDAAGARLLWLATRKAGLCAVGTAVAQGQAHGPANAGVFRLAGRYRAVLALGIEPRRARAARARPGDGPRVLRRRVGQDDLPSLPRTLCAVVTGNRCAAREGNVLVYLNRLTEPDGQELARCAAPIWFE